MASKALASVMMAGLAVLMALPAAAHRISVPVTTISPNPRSGQWEVVHRLSAHDMETALLEEGAGGAVWLDTEAGMAAAQAYVEQRFAITGRSGDIVLDLVGAEVEGDDLFVYFEFDSPDQDIIVENGLMFGGTDSAQQALVNVGSGDGTVVSGFFAPDRQRARARLCAVSCAPR